MRKLSFIAIALLFVLSAFGSAFADAISGAGGGRFKDVEEMKKARDVEGICERFTQNSHESNKAAVDGLNKEYAGTGIYFFLQEPGTVCAVKTEPETKAIEISQQKAAASAAPVMKSGCPCAGGVKISVDGCHITFTCETADDHNTSVSITTPCPVIRGSDPKYPLVKMLSGTLVEWTEPVYSDGIVNVSYGAPNGIGEPGEYYGAQYFGGVKFKMVLSSIDIGQNVKFDVSIANAKKNAKNPLDRKNIEYWLTGGNEYVEILTQRDIYEAYKKRSNEVQAYLVLANKGYRERPWTSYEKFVDAMCDMSVNKSRCKKGLSYNAHRDPEMWGNLYLGNGNSSIIGLYSEVSSHGCHGATVINDKGEPAFAINIKSTWCFYVSANWTAHLEWQLDDNKYLGECCTKPYYRLECNEVIDYSAKSKHTECFFEWDCNEWTPHWLAQASWHTLDTGGTSSGDCGVCQTVTGYIDPEGNMKTDEPYGISFYQSQPLLVRP